MSAIAKVDLGRGVSIVRCRRDGIHAMSGRLWPTMQRSELPSSAALAKEDGGSTLVHTKDIHFCLRVWNVAVFWPWLVRWCNGSTRPFGGFSHGSSPCRTANPSLFRIIV